MNSSALWSISGVRYAAGLDFHHEQDIETAQAEEVEMEEICGQQPGGLGP
jgi:hypothetical protein